MFKSSFATTVASNTLGQIEGVKGKSTSENDVNQQAGNPLNSLNKDPHYAAQHIFVLCRCYAALAFKIPKHLRFPSHEKESPGG